MKKLIIIATTITTIEEMKTAFKLVNKTSCAGPNTFGAIFLADFELTTWFIILLVMAGLAFIPEATFKLKTIPKIETIIVCPK